MPYFIMISIGGCSLLENAALIFDVGLILIFKGVLIKKGAPFEKGQMFFLELFWHWFFMSH